MIQIDLAGQFSWPDRHSMRVPKLPVLGPHYWHACSYPKLCGILLLDTYFIPLPCPSRKVQSDSLVIQKLKIPVDVSGTHYIL